MVLFLATTGCVSTKKYDAAVDEAGRFQDEVVSLTEMLDEANNRVATLTAERDSLIERDRELDRELERVSADLAGSEANNLTLSASLQASNIDRDRIIDSLLLDRQNLTTRLSATNRTLSAAQATAQDLQAQLDEEARLRAAELARQQADYDQLVNALQGELSRGELTIQNLENRLSVAIVDRIIFASGEAIIRQSGLEVLDRVGSALASLTEKRIVIEGHTDNVPIGARLRQLYPTNWELSTARATNVARHLIEKGGVDENIISVAGYAYTRPVATNTTEEGRAQNRRIEILLLPQEPRSLVPPVIPSPIPVDPAETRM
ncbi:OmpA family protein [Candidatus Neomarinimicrobiota bacterium]